jgi:hypothetical protein
LSPLRWRRPSARWRRSWRTGGAAVGGAMEMEEDVGLWALGCCGERRGGATECDHGTTDRSVRVL